MATSTLNDGSAPTGGFVSLNGETYYRIAAIHRMPSFLISVASDADLWMFVTSTGGLTAGRVDADGSLFPYETVDKLRDAHHHSGPITLVRVRRSRTHEVVWQPFSDRSEAQFRIERNLYKNTLGNRLIFEEINHDLALAFRYRWSASNELGWVRTSTLTNRGAAPAALALLDGLRNVLPYGAPLALYQTSSSLVDAYKRSDRDPDTALVTFALTAKIVDRAEAAEELRANAVWCHGLASFDVGLSRDAIDAFRRGESVAEERTLTGRRGHYLVMSRLELEPGADATWHHVADVGRSHVQLATLRERLLENRALEAEIETHLDAAHENLYRIVASADGVQLTGHDEAAAHHMANVLFNCMRGGVFERAKTLATADVRDFLLTRNRRVAERHAPVLDSHGASLTTSQLVTAAAASGDVDFKRLCYEYLPLYFSRRHGDPSRPWNRFSIRVTNPDGTRALRYEGNWRDIFQNWEALLASFPGFLPHVIAKFVNASTVDGFNPYRITRDGVDWEAVDPDDPWSHIGYWGDHQIIYLLKLLEALPRYAPGALEGMLEQEIFCYANVPYRIHDYDEILDDPRETIDYDFERAARIAARVDEIGTDGKLVARTDGSIVHVNLLEKLLVPALAKLSNLVADAGIWMNTQRPEWNDANNALVGNGVSMVTLCYLRRYLSFLKQLLETRSRGTVAISSEVVDWLRRVLAILREHRALLQQPAIDARGRKKLLDALGGTFSEYRANAYLHGLSDKEQLFGGEIVELCACALEHLDHAIRANRREDGLYHSYNLLEVSHDRSEIAVRPLYEMLEGQVAALSSGRVSPSEAVELLEALFTSRMYRDDQHSFMLYPERKLPTFLERNVVPQQGVERIPLLGTLLQAGETSILERDARGVYRFHGDLANAQDLERVLERLARESRWTEAVRRDRPRVLELFEAVFEHRSFTGRSGTMYGYEGLGCIYWHMVAKLLLAVQEIALLASHEKQSATFESLARIYYRIRAGLGFEKTARDYGAFPTDPYSHTPPHAGAQQPGMTGQVKEEILTRFGELGLAVDAGVVRFRPVLLRSGEFLSRIGTYRYEDTGGATQSIEVPAGSLAFSLCQVPIVYERTPGEAWIRVTAADGATVTAEGDRLDAEQSRALFERLGTVTRIDVGVPEKVLCRV